MDKIWPNMTSIIRLSFDETVSITESFYPSLDLTKLFVDLGGSLGLWLGLGLLQLCFSVFDLVKYFKSMFSSSQKLN